MLVKWTNQEQDVRVWEMFWEALKDIFGVSMLQLCQKLEIGETFEMVETKVDSFNYPTL